MGSIGTGGNTLTTVKPVNGLSASRTPTKRAQTLFRSTFAELLRLYKENENPGYGYELTDLRGYDSERVLLSTQDYKGVQNLIDRRNKDNDFDLKLGVISQNKYDEEKRILNSMQRTLNRRWQVHKDLI